MEDPKIIEFQKKLNELGQQKNTLYKVIEQKEHIVKIESNTLENLKRQQENISIIHFSYSKTPVLEIEKMNEADFEFFKEPLNSAVVSGSYIPGLAEETSYQKELSEKHYTSVNTFSILGDSTAVNLIHLRKAKPQLFPDTDISFKKYEEHDRTYEDIEYIRQQLKVNFPDLSEEFDAFIRKYMGSLDSETKYQDLIGARTTFYLKMIFGFAQTKYGIGSKDHLGQIRVFVFGSSHFNSSFEPFLVDVKNLYDKISSQKAPGGSIKLGNVSKECIQSIFVEIISKMAALLRLREREYRP